ncbi:4-hydroxyacetophenone monooxygenase [Pandoraea terrae]|uniref:4-hydroxyacetophenone monooxygenase n=1 Tax=Pandoraea terrae TaxID=1537710 RepID=A0A5E4U6L6_9BURK|nr:NAD(P)/FAD-dependent oxidoreductase [Pandoraea terrae]VVD94534.1 4-hydroxyacetophenone monooxygenase [Pandoraea terrae]
MVEEHTVTNDAARGANVYDVLIMGAGFAGLHGLHRLREDGFRVLALEAAPDTGGAWYWNSYPGARCDVESLVYCYSFSPVIDAEWRWSERYAARDEICQYLQWVATRLDLRKDIRFNSRIAKAHFDKNDQLWHLRTENGEEFLGRHFIASSGPISTPIMPNIPGLSDFRGQMIHTARWPTPGPDFAGKRVGVIGTGSSGTQLIPLVAEQCGQMHVFMRTRNYYMPARNRPLTDEDYEWWYKNRDDVRAKLNRSEISGGGDIMLDEDIAKHPNSTNGIDLRREERFEILEKRWEHGGAMIGYAFRDVIWNPEVNEDVSEFFRKKVHTFVGDAGLAEKLEPGKFPFGTKRPTVGTDFFETFLRPNVSLVDVKASPIERMTEKGVVVAGKEYEIDILILASGFDAVTGALTSIDIRGESGRSLKETWVDGTATFLGISLVDFPNFYMIGGPGSPSVLTNVVRTNEFQVDWIADLLCQMRENGHRIAKVKPEAQQAWADKVEKAATHGFWGKTDSWYVGANVPGKKRQILAFTGGLPAYRKACNVERDSGFSQYGFSHLAELADASVLLS